MTRLDSIAQRQRRSRIMNILFAALVVATTAVSISGAVVATETAAALASRDR
jgi:hypothetical protein